MLGLGRSLPFHDVKNHILCEFVELRAIVLEFLYLMFKFSGLGIIANHFYHTSAGRHAQFREEIAYELHIGIVDTVETDWIHVVDNHDAFDHRAFSCSTSGGVFLFMGMVYIIEKLAVMALLRLPNPGIYIGLPCGEALSWRMEW